MIKSIKKLSKSKTAKWVTLLTLFSGLVITNQQEIIEITGLIFGVEASSYTTKIIEIVIIAGGWLATLKSRLSTESPSNIPLEDR